MNDHLAPDLPKSTADNSSESDDQDESLSLCDLPLTAVDPPPTTINNPSRRSSSSSDFLFEFLINPSANDLTSSADDVIFAGRLLPFTPPPPRRSLSLPSACGRSNSLLSQSNPESTRMTTRPGRKIRRSASSKPPESLPRSPSSSSGVPWYYWMVLGVPARVPAEMELKDIRSRQSRRSVSPKGGLSGEKCSSAAATWRILSVLSCKSHASVDVRKTTPYHS